MTREEIPDLARSLIGCPYIYGTWGKATCSVSLRSRYASYNPTQKEITYKRCPRLRSSSPVDTCDGCKYQGLLAFDCRGFTHYVLEKAGIDISGGYVERQWSDKNWDEKGDIAAMPDLICCVFVYKNGKWKHTGLHVGGGLIIHCSGEVKEDQAVGGANKWTHYAIPKGLYTPEEIRAAHKGGFMRTMKNGSTGDDVRELQEALTSIGYYCGTADGLFGNLTAYAVKSFQRDNGLTVDGIVGPATFEALQKQLHPEEDPEPAAPELDQPELPEDDDEHDPANLVVQVSLSDWQIITECLKKALAIISKL